MVILYAIVSECQGFFAIFSEVKGARKMDLKKRIQELCRNSGISMNQLEQELGFGKGYISKLGKSIPNVSKIQLIANYFNVTVDYLMTGEDSSDKKEVTLTPRDERDIKKDLDNIMEKLSSGEDGPASYNGEELDPEAAELFRDELEIALRRLKIINKEKYTPKKYKK